MATIPIEVIVQDAEAPIVPSEDGTNINTNTEAAVAVPDTGGSGSNIFTGSASSIILPAILLVLAIGSIVAILIHKYHKQKKDKTTRKEKLAVATSSTVAVLAVTVLIGNLVLPATKAATSDITDGITPSEDKISIVVTRDGSAVEESIESTATITSTSDFGYKVLLSMAEGVETSNLYLDGDESSKYYIAPVGVGDEEGAELADNTWGYALEEGTNYTAVPLVDNAATVAEGDEAVEDENLSIYYGVKVSSDLPAGTYSGGEVEYNFVTLEPSNISELTYMQDFAKLSTDAKASVLRSMTEGEQYTLKDSRDKKDYFISKLKDSNVWMTQNLDLDIKSDGSVTYDYTNTDLPANTAWEPSTTTRGSDDTAWGYSDTTPESYNPGDIYWNGDIVTGNSGTLDNMTVADPSETPGGAHYSIGNYYNWTAAVAMNDSSSYAANLQDANQSICPAGWRLPTYEGDKSFDNLVSSQNLTAGPDGNMHTSPVYFVYGGGDWHGGSKDYFYVGGRGQYPTSLIYAGYEPCVMAFWSGGNLETQYHYTGRSSGNMVRCVAR